MTPPPVSNALDPARPRGDGRRIFTREAAARWLRDAPPTRFAGWSSVPAAMLLIALAILMLWGAFLGTQSEKLAVRISQDPTRTDVALYQAIVDRMRDGESYYAAVVTEHRARDYPLRPSVTVRLPTLATFQTIVGPVASHLALCALALAAWLLLVRRLARDAPARALSVETGTLAAIGLLPCLVPILANWHEAWSVAFVMLSLACRSRERWAASVLLGLVAVCLRELALPYLCVMAVVAFVEGNRREAAAWIAAIAVFAAALAIHFALLAHHLAPDDPASQGWVRIGGWPLILAMVQNCTFLTILPPPLTSAVVSLALLGWAAWPSAFGLRGALLLAGYVVAFMLIGRSDNFYWGLMFGPILLIGLAFAPAALRDLVRAATSRRVQTAPAA